MMQRTTSRIVQMAILSCCLAATPRQADAQAVKIEPSDDRLSVLIGGEPFTAYIFRGHSRPLLFPIIGPHRLNMTRSFPVKMDVPGEAHDHPHQKPMFFAYGSVNGVNFFAESPDFFDHPGNPRHPTWWMARGYGYVAADPFGANAIGGEPPGAGDMTIRKGTTVTFRYRFLFHEGDPKQAQIAEQYRQFAARPSSN